MASGTMKNTSSLVEVNSNLKYQKFGGVVTVFLVNAFTSTHNTWTSIGTLPSGARPKESFYSTALTSASSLSSNTTTCDFMINTSGAVSIRNSVSGTSINASATYLV